MDRYKLWTMLDTKSDRQLIEMAQNSMQNGNALRNLGAVEAADNETRLTGEIHALANSRRPHIVEVIAQVMR